MRVYYRNIIVLEILSLDAKVESDEVLANCSIGLNDDCSAAVVAEESVIVDAGIMAALARAQGTDPSFFGLED